MVSVYTYMRVLALLVLVAVADALAFRPARRARDDKSILRLAQDEPIPEGWRLATASDAECNRVCFGLVLRPRDWRRKRDEVDLASNLKVSAPDSRNAFASAYPSVSSSARHRRRSVRTRWRYASKRAESSNASTSSAC